MEDKLKVCRGAALIGVVVLVACSKVGGVTPPVEDVAPRVGDAFCSLEGIMKLVPETRNASGKFEIPSPKKDMDAFLRVHQTLSRVVTMALAQSAVDGDPFQVAAHPNSAMTFGKKWRSAEVGVATDGARVSFPDGGAFASYGGKSFLSGIEPAPGTDSVIYQVKKADGSIPALVAARPTELPCVNRLLLAAANTAGTWMPPTYAFGPAGGDALLVVDMCVDLANPSKQGTQTFLTPSGALFIAIQWADLEDLSHMRTDDVSGMHP